MKKRVIALCLSALLVLGLFAGCGKEETPQEPSAGPASSGSETADPLQALYAWKASYTPVTGPEGLTLEYINSYALTEDSLYFAASYVGGKEQFTDPETGETVEYDTYTDGIFRMDLQSGRTTQLETAAERELPEGYEGSTYVQNLMAGADGSLWVVMQTSTYFLDLPEGYDGGDGEQWQYYVEGPAYLDLYRYGTDGSLLETLTLDVPEDIYISNVMADSKGNLYASDYQSVYLFDQSGALAATLSNDMGGGELMQISADTIGVVSWGEDGQKFLPVDPEKKAFGEGIPLEQNAYNLLPGSGEYLYYYHDNDSIYGMKDGAEKPEKLLSWLECDVDSNNVDRVTILPDGRIAALERNYSGEHMQSNLIFMEQVDAASIPEKKTLTLACFGLDWSMRPRIVDFNRSHDDVRIVVRDYLDLAGDSTYEDAMQKLNTEILSGNVPDLMCLNGLPADRYGSKGLLADLWPMIDSDPELGREDLMSHLFDAMSVDGKLYQITDTFSITTAACRTAITGDRTFWSLDEALEALNGLQSGAGIFGETDTKDDILTQCLSFDLDSYIDWANGRCSFDSPAFVEMLEFANTFPAEFNWEEYDWETAESEYSRLQNGKQLMTTCYLSSFPDVQVQYAFHGGDVNFIGFPSEDGKGSCFTLGTTMSISSACDEPELAWSFVRELLLEENQTQDLWQFPTNKAAFDAYVEEQMTPEYTTDPETGEQVEVSNHGYSIGNDFSVEIYSLKQEELDAFMALYENCTGIYTYDQEIMDIIREECAPFFAGQKTAEETAKLIQNRIGLYVAERM